MNKQNNKCESIRWITTFMKSHKCYFYINITATTLLTGINVLKAYLIQELFNEGINLEVYTLWFTVLTFIGISIIGMVLAYLSKLYNGKFVHHLIMDMRDELAKHVTSINLKYLDDRKSGDMISRLNNDVNQISQFLCNNLPTFISQVLLAVVAALYILSINWKLLIVSLIITPFGMVFAYFVNKNTQKYYVDSFTQLGNATAEVEQSILGVDIIKSFNLYQYFCKKIDYRYNCVFKSEMKSQKYISMIQPICFTLSYAPRLVGVIYSGYLVTKGEITIGTIVLVLLLLEWIVAPTVFAPFFMNNFNRMLAAVERIKEIFDLLPERSSGININSMKSDIAITFKNVKFSYDNSVQVLKNINFDIEKLGITALVGTSGSGKSTIIDLITCLYEYEEGSIELFGNEIKTINPKSIRDKIAVVSQQAYIFPGTVAENIGYGSIDASFEKIKLAAHYAIADGFIEKLPNLYDTLIGEGGVGLSGGQKQRISLARALLKDSPIIIFDEPTAALDYSTENLIQETFIKLSENKTILIITHRLSTLLNADQIIVLDHGQVVESGTRHDLINKKGQFYNMFKEEILAYGFSLGGNYD